MPTAGKTVKGANGVMNQVSLPDATGSLLQKMLDRAAQKTVVLAMGNPYIGRDFPALQNYICTFSNVTVSEVSAAKALFGEIPIHGHMPVQLSNSRAHTPSDVQAAQVAKK